MEDGAEYEIAIGDETKTCQVRASGGSTSFHQDEYFLAIHRSGEQEFLLKAKGLAGEGLMVLQDVMLEPK